jgi:hypothetical protein
VCSIKTDGANQDQGPLENSHTKPAWPHGGADNRLIRARWWVALAGLLAGLAAFGAGEAIYELIPAEKSEIITMGKKAMATTPESTRVADTRNAALTFGVLGLCLGGCLGMAGGVARRSTSAVLIAGLLGSVMGMAVGAGVPLAILPYIFKIQPVQQDYELVFSMIVHASTWGLMGAAAGLAFAIGLRQPTLHGRAVLAGFAGAVLGTVAFDLIGAVFFPLASTGDAISKSWASRLMARLMVTLATAALVILVVNGPPSDKASRPAEVVPPAA